MTDNVSNFSNATGPGTAPTPRAAAECYIVDAAGCDAGMLEDGGRLAELLIAGCERAGAPTLWQSMHRDSGGHVVVIVVTAGHVVVRTYPAERAAFCEVVGVPELRGDVVLAGVLGALAPRVTTTRVVVRTVPRGTLNAAAPAERVADAFAGLGCAGECEAARVDGIVCPGSWCDYQNDVRRRDRRTPLVDVLNARERVRAERRRVDYVAGRPRVDVHAVRTAEDAASRTDEILARRLPNVYVAVETAAGVAGKMQLVDNIGFLVIDDPKPKLDDALDGMSVAHATAIVANRHLNAPAVVKIAEDVLAGKRSSEAFDAIVAACMRPETAIQDAIAAAAVESYREHLEETGQDAARTTQPAEATQTAPAAPIAAEAASQPPAADIATARADAAALRAIANDVRRRSTTEALALLRAADTVEHGAVDTCRHALAAGLRGKVCVDCRRARAAMQARAMLDE